MSEYTSGNTYIKRRADANASGEKKELAGDYLAEKGYERQAKPREVNGGHDRVPRNYTQKNKVRLNGALAHTPIQARPIAKKQSAKTQVNVTGLRKERSKTPFPTFTVLCLIALTVVALYVVHLYIELDELDATITEYNNMITEMKAEERVLQTQKASKYNLEEIERIAKEKYGMVDADQLPKEYITPDAEDSIEIMETDNGDDTPAALLSGFAGVVSDLLSYIN